MLYSDGVTEAFSATGAMFEEADMLACLANRAGKSGGCHCSCLRRAIRQHAGNHPQSDDITILSLVCPAK